MTRKNDSFPANAETAPRRAWTAPRMRRLATSSAAFGPSPVLDAEGFS
jgi:hypothetical protein